MSITSFSKPSDADILNTFVDQSSVIGFADKGSIHQKVNETLYIRTVKLMLNQEEVLKKVVFTKKGIAWLFKKIENITAINNHAM